LTAFNEVKEDNKEVKTNTLSMKNWKPDEVVNAMQIAHEMRMVDLQCKFKEIQAHNLHYSRSGLTTTEP